MEVRRLAPGDEGVVAAAARLFDATPREDATARFLAEPTHHLLMAFDGDTAVGFVTGVETTHPDKGTEMFLYELSVAEDARGRGVGRALVTALADLARDRRCYGMWVLTERGNDAALATYRSAGGRDSGTFVMLDWRP